MHDRPLEEDALAARHLVQRARQPIAGLGPLALQRADRVRQAPGVLAVEQAGGQSSLTAAGTAR